MCSTELQLIRSDLALGWKKNLEIQTVCLVALVHIYIDFHEQNHRGRINCQVIKVLSLVLYFRGIEGH